MSTDANIDPTLELQTFEALQALETELDTLEDMSAADRDFIDSPAGSTRAVFETKAAVIKYVRDLDFKWREIYVWRLGSKFEIHVTPVQVYDEDY